jgi:hypothetical protein
MLAEVLQADDLLAECAAMRTGSLSDRDLRITLDVVARIQARVAAITAHLVRDIDVRGIPAVDGVRKTAWWLAQRLRVNPSVAARLVTLADTVDRCAGLDEALGSGGISAAHVEVIAAAVQDLPVRVGVDKATAALSDLIGLAGQFDPAVVGKCGERILAHLDPALAEKTDREKAEREEKRAAASRALTLTDLGDGRFRLSGLLPAEGAAIVNAAIDPLTKPAGAAGTDPRTPTQRRADALVGVCELALRTGELPDNGGDRPQVVVTVDYDTLCGQLGCGLLDTGHRLSPETVRRMACDALIIPGLLNGTSKPLDIGRAKRAVDGAIRRALVLRDGGCAFPGCDRHPRWCHAHHVQHWSRGGATSLHNTALLCGFHHRMIHHSDWDIRIATDGLPEFLPPSFIDPERRPRRNPYHRRQAA